MCIRDSSEDIGSLSRQIEKELSKRAIAANEALATTGGGVTVRKGKRGFEGRSNNITGHHNFTPTRAKVRKSIHMHDIERRGKNENDGTEYLFRYSVTFGGSSPQSKTADAIRDAKQIEFGGLATDANGNLLTGTYRNWQYSGDARLAFLNSIGYFDDLGRVATANDALAAYGLPTDPVCGTLQFGYQPCFLADRLLGVISDEQVGQWLAQDNLPAESSQSSVDLLVTGEFEAFGKFIGFAATLELSLIHI